MTLFGCKQSFFSTQLKINFMKRKIILLFTAIVFVMNFSSCFVRQEHGHHEMHHEGHREHHGEGDRH